MTSVLDNSANNFYILSTNFYFELFKVNMNSSSRIMNYLKFNGKFMRFELKTVSLSAFTDVRCCNFICKYIYAWMI